MAQRVRDRGLAQTGRVVGERRGKMSSVRLRYWPTLTVVRVLEQELSVRKCYRGHPVGSIVDEFRYAARGICGLHEIIARTVRKRHCSIGRIGDRDDPIVGVVGEGKDAADGVGDLRQVAVGVVRENDTVSIPSRDVGRFPGRREAVPSLVFLREKECPI